MYRDRMLVRPGVYGKRMILNSLQANILKLKQKNDIFKDQEQCFRKDSACVYNENKESLRVRLLL